MSEAKADTVLGDFNEATFEYNGMRSRFYRRGEQFWVNTEGPDGKPTDYRVRYTFGYRPLQQYLIAFPGGRYQALGIAWDSRTTAEGGQRWFHLYPNDRIDFKNPLHWTGPYQNWNSRCADCHVTGWDKQFNADTLSYRSTWAESGVGCESCHGPGVVHSKRARQGFKPGEDRAIVSDSLEEEGRWQRGSGARIASRAERPATTRQVQLCAGCHSRRTPIGRFAPGHDYLNAFVPALLGTDIYHADGQIRDEVFVGGSFWQSAMHGKGVVCGNCHDVHSGELKAGPTNTCLQCHGAETYAVTAHHHHPVNTAGAQCTNCHMPETTYMVVDPRRDHSIRVPDPQRSLKTGAPNACNQCHVDRSAAWAASAVAAWARDRRQNGSTPGLDRYRRLGDSRGQTPLARRERKRLALDTLAPTIHRATAFSEISAASETDLEVLARGLQDVDPLVRLGAARAFLQVPPPYRKSALWPLLSDPVKSVRLEAIRALSALPADQLDAAGQRQLGNAVQAFIDAQMVMADTAGAWLNIAEVKANRADVNGAEAAYRKALELEPNLIPGYLNLADLYRATNRDQLGRGLLTKAVGLAPDDPAAHYALAMLHIRERQYQKAIEALKRAVALDSGNGYYAAVYAIALAESGRKVEALGFAERALDNVDDPQHLLMFLRDSYFQAGNMSKAADIQRRLREFSSD